MDKALGEKDTRDPSHDLDRDPDVIQSDAGVGVDDETKNRAKGAFITTSAKNLEKIVQDPGRRLEVKAGVGFHRGLAFLKIDCFILILMIISNY